MNCKKCGTVLTPEDKFCKVCGTVVEANATVSNPQVAPVVSMVQPVIQPMMAPVQPVVSAPQPSISMMQPTAKKGNMIVPIVIGVLVLAVAALGYVVLTGDKSEPKEEDKVVVETGDKVKLKNFTFSIPNKYIYETTADALAISNEAGEWVIEIAVGEYQYDLLLNNKARIKANLDANGYENTLVVEKTYKGRKYLVSEASANGTKGIFGYTKANASNVFAVAAYNQENTYDYKLIEEVTAILNSAVYSAAGTSIKVKTIDTNDLLEAAK